MKRKLSLLLALMMLLGSINVVTLLAAPAPAVGNQYLQANLEKFPDMFDYEKNQTKVAFSNDASRVIMETVWIEVPCDVDGDGQRDLVRAEFRRPIETRTAGLKSPVIAMATPYVNTYDSIGRLTGGNVDTDNDEGINNPDTRKVKLSDIEYKGPTYKDLLAEGNGHMSSDLSKYGIPAPRVPLGSQEEGTPASSVTVSGLGTTYIPLGYTSARLTIIGSNYGEGFLTYGDYAENLCVSSFVDWLNGRCNAFSNPTDRILVKTPEWATGDVFMTGTSYEGTLPFAGLITGVEGLRAIMPIAPVTSSYEYYRGNGGVYAPGGWQGEDVTMIIPYCAGRLFWGSGNTPSSPVYSTYQPTAEHPTIWSKYWDYLYNAYVKQDRKTGDYNSWWDERNQAAFGLMDVRDDVGIIMQHGFNDDNVKFKQTALILEMAKEKGISAKAIFHQGMHTGVTNDNGLNLNPQLHKYIDHYLYGVDNGMPDDMPDVRVQSNVDVTWKEYPTWPMGENQKFYLNGNDRVGTMSLTPQRNASKLSFKDEFALGLDRGNPGTPTIPAWVEGWAENQPKFAGRVNTMAAAQFYRWRSYMLGGADSTAAWSNGWKAPTTGVYDLTKAINDRLLYVFDVEEDMTISGTIKMTAKVAADKKVGYLSAMLVDVGSARRYMTGSSSGTTVSTTGTVIGPNGSSINLFTWNRDAAETPLRIISRGSVDIQNPNYDGTIWSDNVANRFMAPYTYQTTAITPGEFYPYTWEMDVMEYTIPAGHKLALVLYGSDPEYTPRPYNPTGFTVEIGPKTYLSLPVVGYEEKAAIELSYDGKIVRKGQYLNVDATLREQTSANVAVLDFIYDTTKFDYANVSLPAGASLISADRIADGVKITVMIPSYEAKDLVTVMLRAKEDAELIRGDNPIYVLGELVVKDEDGIKHVVQVSSTTCILTDDRDDGEIEPGKRFTMIDLSDIIDMFGFDSSYPAWRSVYRFFDFNYNKKIDIDDISYVAKFVTQELQ